MAVAVSPKQAFDYVLKEDRDLPSEDRTVFKLRPLTQAEMLILNDRARETYDDADGHTIVRPKIGTFILAVLDLGLVGWLHLRDAEGQDVPFDSGRRRGNYERLRPGWTSELAAAITEASAS